MQRGSVQSMRVGQDVDEIAHMDIFSNLDRFQS